MPTSWYSCTCMYSPTAQFYLGFALPLPQVNLIVNESVNTFFLSTKDRARSCCGTKLQGNNLNWFLFIWFTGPLAWAVLAWRNSLVFHSLDKITSLFIHLTPGILLHSLRWLATDPYMYVLRSTNQGILLQGLSNTWNCLKHDEVCNLQGEWCHLCTTDISALDSLFHLANSVLS